MSSFIINGGIPLRGDVTVSGSKNASLPVLFATLITDGVSRIRNLPDIKDVNVALEIIKCLGARIDTVDGVTVIDTTRLNLVWPGEELVSSLRASTYLIGAMLVRFGRARLSSFGGCNFSVRPIDLHIKAAAAFGAKLLGEELFLDKPCGCVHKIEKASVGATVNSLLLAAGTPTESMLLGCAREPHVDTLIDYLRSAGAEIFEDGGTLRIRGGKLCGGNVTIPGDMIEAGTYLCASALTGGSVRVLGANAKELDSFINPLREAGVKFNVEFGISMCGLPREPVEIYTSPYPAFPTDLQPIIAPLLAKGSGGSITEGVWQGRFGYLKELAKLGVMSRIVDNFACIYPSKLKCGEINAVDLRGGAAGVISALCSVGESRISCAGNILRGYENLDGKLRSLGADVSVV